jgi:tripartite-type tricarboxylate transporter receptor subunit TctC
VPFPPGGSTDLLGRLVANGLEGHYASSVILENKPGAGARIGIAAAKSMPKDGTSMLLTPATTMALYPYVFKDMQYDVTKDFVPVYRVSFDSFVAAVGPAVPADVKTLSDFVDWCNANPARAMFGSAATGSSPHLLGALLGKRMKVPFTHVPYNGGGPTIIALLGGNIPLSFNNFTNVTEFLASGRLRLLANTAPRRSPFYSDVPTVAESGFKELELEEWFGVFAPAGTPAAIVQALSSAIQSVMKAPQTAATLAKQGIVPFTTDTPEQFALVVKNELEHWGKVIKVIGLEPQ